MSELKIRPIDIPAPVATEADMTGDSVFMLDTPQKSKRLPANLVAKASEQAALTTYAQNTAHSIAPEFVPNVLTVEGKCYWHDGELFVCNVAYTGDWVPGNFTATSIDALFARKDVQTGIQTAVSALQTKTDNLDFAQKKEVSDRKAVDVATRSVKTNKFFENADDATEVITGGYYNASGQWQEVSGYTNNVYAAKDYTSVIYFDSAGGGVYRQISIFNGEPSQANFVKRLTSNDGNLPTIDSPLYILPGQSLVISNGLNSTSEFTYYTTWNGSLEITNEASEAILESIRPTISSLNTKTDNISSKLREEIGLRIANEVSERQFSETKFFTDASKATSVITGGYFSADGTWVEEEGYTNNVYGKKDYTSIIYFNSAGGGEYRQISIFEGSATKENFVARYRSSDTNLPTVDNPLVILPGQVFVISNGLNNTTDFSYYTTWEGDVELDKNTFDITTGLTLTRNSNLVQVLDGYYGDAYGGVTANANYVSYIYDVSENTTLYVRPTTASYLSVSVTNKEMNSGVRYRQKASAPSEYDLPTEENPISIVAGKRLIISEVKSGIDNWNVVLPEEKWRSSFNNRVPLAQSHINQVLTQVKDGNIFVKYFNNAGVESSTERLEVYVPTKVGYCRYDFLHNVNVERNCDCWRVAYAYAVDVSMQSRFALTRSGEWECAIRLENRDDFSGGYTHGDEMLVGTPTFLMDGETVTLASLADGVRCGEFKCVTKTNLYDPNDHETVFAIHGCEHTFTRDGLRLRQSVDWQGTYNIISTYMAMNLPLKTVTSKYYTDKTVYPQTIPDPVSIFVQNAKSVCLFDPTSGVENNFTIGRDYPVDNPLLYITDNASTYNKCYFVINLSTPKEITSGTNWMTESFVDFKIGK